MIKSFLRKIYPQDEFLALGIFLSCFAITNIKYLIIKKRSILSLYILVAVSIYLNIRI